MPAVGTATTPDLSEMTPIVIVVSVTPLSVAPCAGWPEPHAGLERADLAVVSDATEEVVVGAPRAAPLRADRRRTALACSAGRDKTRQGDEKCPDPRRQPIPPCTISPVPSLCGVSSGSPSTTPGSRPSHEFIEMDDLGSP